jgi:hypothetical protein
LQHWKRAREARFSHLESELFEAGFTRAAQGEVTQIFENGSLFCRSEAFSRVIDLLLEEAPIPIVDKQRANMCMMASGNGFRVAMQEGFSGKDVDGMVKTVITFTPIHLTTKSKIDRENTLWNTKPQTAEVSLAGGGEIFSEDVMMVSFRFPIHHFPEDTLSQSEREQLEESGMRFIVRHYIPTPQRKDHA